MCVEDLRRRVIRPGISWVRLHDNRRSCIALVTENHIVRCKGKLTVNVLLDRLVRQNRSTINVNLIANRNIITKHSHVLETRPLAHGAVPADNRALDPSVVLDAAVLEQHTALEAHTVANDNIWADGNIGTDTAVLSYLGRLVDENVAAVNVGFRSGGQQLGVLARERREVEACSRQEVLGLTNVHPEALEVEGVEEAVLDNGGESLLLNGCRAELDALEHAGVHDVDTGVDAVADELDGLLDETVDFGGVARLVDYDTVFGGLFDLCDDNGAFVAVLLVELGELLEGVVAGDVGVEDEEGRVVLAQDVLGELEGAGGAEGLGLDGECDGHVVLLLVLRSGLFVCSGLPWGGYTHCLERLGHDFRAVVDSEDNICDTGSGQGLDLMLDHRLVRELDERLGVGEGLQLALAWPLLLASRGSRASAARGGRHTRGLRRVPNPPTRMMAALAVSYEQESRNWPGVPFILAVL